LTRMLARRVRSDGFIDPCIPTRAAKPPSGPAWVHEVKHDGYRLIVRREGPTVRLFTRRGYDWTDRYPAIAAAAGKLRARSFTMDGEAVVVGADGVAVFDALHRRHRASDALLYAFDLPELDGEDLRPLPLPSARRSWRGYWRGLPPGSRSTSTPMRMAPRCSGTPARWASKASYRSGLPRPTSPDRRETGSRSRTRTAPR
jgi:ATP dependent DNA ligase domain